MLFTDSPILFWWSFCSVERIYLCNLVRGHYEEHFCEIILDFGQWLNRRNTNTNIDILCHLKIFLFSALMAIWFTGAERPMLFW